MLETLTIREIWNKFLLWSAIAYFMCDIVNHCIRHIPECHRIVPRVPRPSFHMLAITIHPALQCGLREYHGPHPAYWKMDNWKSSFTLKVENRVGGLKIEFEKLILKIKLEDWKSKFEFENRVRGLKIGFKIWGMKPSTVHFRATIFGIVIQDKLSMYSVQAQLYICRTPLLHERSPKNFLPGVLGDWMGGTSSYIKARYLAIILLL